MFAIEQVANWCRFYKEVFGIKIDPASVSLPSERAGFGWIVLVAQGLTRNQVFEKCAERFSSWRYYNDLNCAVTINDRESTATYAIRVRDRVEADEENQISAETAWSKGVKGMTNLERMLLELWYHWETNDHLDKETLTICSGSRYSDGCVPDAHCSGEEFSVSDVRSADGGGDWRVREVEV